MSQVSVRAEQLISEIPSLHRLWKDLHCVLLLHFLTKPVKVLGEAYKALPGSHLTRKASGQGVGGEECEDHRGCPHCITVPRKTQKPKHFPQTPSSPCCCVQNHSLAPWTSLVEQWIRGFLGGSSSKEPAFRCWRYKRRGFDSLGWDDSLEEGMVNPSSILAWRIPQTEESDRLQSIRSQRVRHD